MIPDNACSPRITAAAGTELAGAFSGSSVISRPYYKRPYSSFLTDFYTPKCFLSHAALLRQPSGHCAIFLTAASRRSLGRISVPVWPIALSGLLSIAVLVSRYLTNKLMDRKPILKRQALKRYPPLIQITCEICTVFGISTALAVLSPT